MARILIVDDDDDIREFVQLVLEQEGHELRGAENGRVALDRAAEQPPDLILLDMRMPIMDGWEFMQAYRARPGPHARVVVMTATRDPRTATSQTGPDGYLAKPFDLDELLGAVGGGH